MQHVKLFIESIWGNECAQRLFDEIDQIIIHSLKACQGCIINDRHCFECYGYDILIDANLKPWLVEVNASPSLSTTTKSDRIMKMGLIRDVLSIVVPKDIQNHKGACHLGPCEDSGEFTVLYDEATQQQPHSSTNTKD